MRKLVMAAAMVGAAVLAACTPEETRDAGPVTERRFEVGTFDRIELAGAYDAQVTVGGKPGVSAKGGRAILDNLLVEVRDGQLRIRPKDRRLRWGKGSKIQLTIAAPALTGAALAGSGNLSVDKVSGERFEGAVAGSGNLSIGAAEVGALKIAIAGSGDASATGRAKEAEYTIAGSGDIAAGGLASETVKVSIAGSGGVRAQATKTGTVSIAGSGDVEITGGAKCEVSKMGSGNVRCS